MSAHTPGPWMVLPSVDRGQFCILTEHGNRIDIAVTYGSSAVPREANAKLIAAAPELLEALIAVRDRKHTPDLWEMVNAAITKATGAQQ